MLLHTGQHYDDALSDRFFRELAIPAPDVDLGIGSGPHGVQTGCMLAGIEAVLVERKPDLVLVYGDTNSTLAGALAATKLHVPVAHVEAGLRSFNRRMPEEVNRVVVDQLSDLLLCPSDTAAANLAREGITRGVHVVGDVMAEALQAVHREDRAADALSRFAVTAGRYLLATVHRAENTDDRGRLHAILGALDAVGEPVLLPAHPRLRAVLRDIAYEPAAHVRVVDPVGYADMIALVANARLVLTDSGGLQKEAYWLGVPCITMRDETEWIETVAAGWNVVVGADGPRIVSLVRTLGKPASRPPLYGEGQAVARVLDVLDSFADRAA